MCHEKRSSTDTIGTFVRMLLIVILFLSCIHDDTDDCIREKEMITVEILPDWEGQKGLPDGIRVSFYSLKTNKYVQDNYLTNGGNSEIREDDYQLILYNNDSEKIVFRNIGKYETHEAATNQVYRPSFQNPVQGEQTYAQPDNLWWDHIDSFEISSESTIIRFKPKQMVCSYTGRIEVEGLQYAHEVRGAVTGMIGRLQLASGKGSEASTIFFDATSKSNTVSFSFHSFGTFCGESVPTKHYLALEFLLKNGIVQRNVDITNLIKKLPHGGDFAIDAEISLPPDTTSTNGRFDSNVNDWKEIIYPIPI